MVDLLSIAKNLLPEVPVKAFMLDQYDGIWYCNAAEWDDKMPFPVVDRQKYYAYGFGISSLLVNLI